MSIYKNELINLFNPVDKKINNAVINTLFELGIIDHTLCKVYCIRLWVEKKCKENVKKVDAMWMAAEHFACTFEYVRKCIYYYKDVGKICV